MKVILSFCLLINCALLLYGCGETKEDIECRRGLNGIINGVNLIYKKFDDDKTFELNLKTNEIRDFYGGYVDNLMELGRGQNNIKITDRFKITDNSLDTLVKSSIDYMMERKNARLAAYKIYEARKDWIWWNEMEVEWELFYGKNHPETQNIRESQVYPKLRIILLFGDYNGMVLKVDSIRNVLKYQALNINQFIKKLEFKDSLNIITTIALENDLFENEYEKLIKLYELASH